MEHGTVAKKVGGGKAVLTPKDLVQLTPSLPTGAVGSYTSKSGCRIFKMQAATYNERAYDQNAARRYQIGRAGRLTTRILDGLRTHTCGYKHS